jgi:hypothetical protein
MLNILIIVLEVLFIIYDLNKQYKEIINLNNIILEQKSEIIKINSICETLHQLKLNNYNDIISKKYINFSLRIIPIYLISIIIWLILPVIFIYVNIIAIIIIIILYSGHYYINNNVKEIENREKEIINKKDEINNIYIKKLLILIETNDDINNISLSIDEYISNYSYLMYMNKDKNELLNELKQELIQKKKNELTALMNTRLKSFHEIKHEIVKYELEELNKDLDEYIKILEIKINAINEQSQINAIIININ